MKRAISLLLAAAMLFGLFAVTAFAEDGTQEALKTVKQRIEDTNDYEEFYSSSYQNGDAMSYRFTWNHNGEDGYKNLYVTVTGTGVITNYSKYSSDMTYSYGKPSFDRVPVAEAMETAKAFLAKIDPTVCGEYELTSDRTSESLWGGSYSFSLQRMVSGIPVSGDTGYVYVAEDGQTVTDFGLTYTETLVFEDAARAISRAEAEKDYAEKIGMDLYYTDRYEDGKRTPYPVYVPQKTYGTYISAITGEPMSPLTPKTPGGNKGINDMAMPTAAPTEAAAAEPEEVRFSEAELKQLDNLAGLLGIEEAEKLVRGNKLFWLDDTMRLYRNSCTQDTFNERYLYSLNFTADNGSASFTLNGDTGEIYNFSHYDWTYREKEIMSAEEAQKLARSAAEELAAEKLAEYQEKDSSTGSVSYVRYANGIRYPSDSVYAYVSTYTGKLESYSINYSNVTFPSLEGILTADEAAAKMFAQRDYELVYIRDCQSPESEVYDKGSLIYRLKGSSMQVDPYTGEMSKPVETVTLPEYTDIAGHYGEKEITTLRRFGIGFAESEFRPDDAITKGEFLSLISGIFYRYSPVILYKNADYTAACTEAVSRSILPAEDADADTTLTRETMAMLMIRVMGLEDVAKLQGIYRSPFTDVTRNEGYISILWAMGVIHGNGDGTYSPDLELTRAQAAIVIYNYIAG